MDGYLDQQVPYTLANVRMEEVFVLLWICLFFVNESLPGFFICARSVSRPAAAAAAAIDSLKPA